MSAQDIRDIVARCYDDMGPLLVPNPLDGANPATPPGTGSSGTTPGPEPGDVIRNLVGRCYALPPELEPNPLDQLFPPPTFDPPEKEKPLTPPEIIQQLVGRCYPTLPPLTPPPPIDPPPPPTLRIPLIDGPGPVLDLIGLKHPTPTLTIKWPTTGDMTWIVTTGDPDDQCDEVFSLLQKSKARELPDYSQDGKGPPGWWENIETKEKLYCKIRSDKDDKWNECVRNALECMFRPYFGGGWKPPKADCEAYWPQGWSGNKSEICVENCFPDRIPVYESTLSNGTLSVQFDASGNLVATGTGTATVVLKLQWNDRPWTYDVAIDTIQMGGLTWTRTGRSGEEIKTLNITGAGTTSITMNGNSGGFSIVDNNTRICMRDLDGTDCNANFIITNANINGDHAYDNQGAKAGYSLTQTAPLFWVLRDEIPGVTRKLFRFYSSSKVDTFLTTNPGSPDSEGAGERAMMNANGMGSGEVIGHVFPTATAMNSYLAEGEQAESLHRFFSSNPFDHKYAIDGDFIGGLPKKIPDRYAYRIPADPIADLNIEMDVEKGDSSYNSATGFYLADETGPKWGRIVVTSARGGLEMYSAYVPTAKMKQYRGGTMGFFLIPNGANTNTLTANQEITFEPLNAPYDGGFRGTGINSSQNNYCMFSDRLWNPNDKEHTKWHGKSQQHWEDLLNGDDDYNDLRFWHRLGWTYGGFKYEGVQCYVYGVQAPPKVFRKIDTKTKCDTRILKESFKDVMVRRMDCGEKLPNFQTNDVDWECDTCTGGYAIRLHDDQTIEAAPGGGSFRFISMGGIVGGLFGDCMKFTMKMKKNGVDIFTKQYEAKFWPKLGADLYDQDITLATDDTLTLQLVSIDSGPVTGDIALECAFYNLETTEFDSNFKLRLGTLSHDNVIGSTGGNPTVKQIQAPAGEGEVTGIAFSFRPTNRQEFEWEAGSKYGDTLPAPTAWTNSTVYTRGDRVLYTDNTTDPQNPVTYGPFQAVQNISAGLIAPTHTSGINAQGWHYINGVNVAWPEDTVPDPGYPYTYVWAQGAPVRMHGTMQQNPQLPGNTRMLNNNLMPSITGGYIDTGYTYDKNPYQSSDILQSYLYRSVTGTYNHLLEEFLFTRFETLQGSGISAANKDILIKAAPTTFARGKVPWYNLGANSIGTQYTNAVTSTWNRTNYFSPITFIHDYTLDNFHGTGGSSYADACKIRVGITFYPVLVDTVTESKQVHYWQAVIQLIDVINVGAGYTKAVEFVLSWPPERDPITEDPTQTPYYPDQESNFSFPQGRVVSWWENEDVVKRSPKEAFYQESHNKNSVVWYSGTDRTKFRVKFKVTVTSVTAAP
tara:strand:+ start:520 stop:4497 length:3978 start_codon:yes stop_codon:yes gene_type:complete